MGVPAFFRWLTKKYPDVIQLKMPVIDNLYLDMNAIIHPCCHPEHGAAPKSEEDMLQAIIAYIERILAITKPRKLLYMAIDGVAPRAKINQQRSRRFRTAKENPPKEGSFDSNCITPGTVFMQNLSASLCNWIRGKRFAITVILSDATVPGEGEHKIMDYIRANRGSGLSHCLCGGDADLIMLGLASHELKFTIIREELSLVEFDHPKDFISVSLATLRKHLIKALNPQNRLDNFRLVDDWVALCFLIGNDFLPHLPTLEIHEGAIDTLMTIYKKVLQKGEFLTNNGILNPLPYYEVLAAIGLLEDAVFAKRFPKRKQSPPKYDPIRYTEPGWKDRYYANKLGDADVEEVTDAYMEGLTWVLHYYYHGPPSWEWYYPYHYAPFASDFINPILVQFEPNTIPLTPFEQLMSVLPPASSDLLPAPLASLMLDEDSPIIQFYPTDFKIDLNGKKALWMGVALLPFVDQDLLLEAVASKRSELTADELERERPGEPHVFKPRVSKYQST